MGNLESPTDPTCSWEWNPGDPVTNPHWWHVASKCILFPLGMLQSDVNYHYTLTIHTAVGQVTTLHFAASTLEIFKIEFTARGGLQPFICKLLKVYHFVPCWIVLPHLFLCLYPEGASCIKYFHFCATYELRVKQVNCRKQRERYRKHPVYMYTAHELTQHPIITFLSAAIVLLMCLCLALRCNTLGFYSSTFD